MRRYTTESIKRVLKSPFFDNTIRLSKFSPFKHEGVAEEVMLKLEEKVSTDGLKNPTDVDSFVQYKKKLFWAREKSKWVRSLTILEDMRILGKTIEWEHYFLVIMCLVDCEEADRAYVLVKEMEEQGISVGEEIYRELLANSGKDVKLAEYYFEKVPKSLENFHFLMDVYVNAKDINALEDIFQSRIPFEGLEPNADTVLRLMKLHAQQHNLDRVKELSGTVELTTEHLNMVMKSHPAGHLDLVKEIYYEQFDQYNLHHNAETIEIFIEQCFLNDDFTEVYLSFRDIVEDPDYKIHFTPKTYYLALRTAERDDYNLVMARYVIRELKRVIPQLREQRRKKSWPRYRIENLDRIQKFYEPMTTLYKSIKENAEKMKYIKAREEQEVIGAIKQLNQQKFHAKAKKIIPPTINPKKMNWREKHPGMMGDKL